MQKHFILPDSGLIRNLNFELLRLKLYRPEIFYEDSDIIAVFGCPTICIFNGGRPNVECEYRGLYSTENIVKTYKKIFKVDYRFTFTNLLLEPKHMDDTFGNQVLSIAEKYNCGVLLSNMYLKNYIEKNYPHINIYYSVTCRDTTSTIEDLNNAADERLSVLPIDFNKDIDSLSTIRNKDNIEILCNEGCVYKCEYKKAHYLGISKYNLGLQYSIPKCMYYSSAKKGKDCQIYRKDLDKYSDLGFSNFKLEGRFDPKLVLNSYLDFLIKDEYKEEMKPLFKKLLNYNGE